MHNLHLADQILKTALGIAEKNNLKKIFFIKIELGDFIEHGERITPENLKFNFNLVSKNSLADSAQLKIKKIEGGRWSLKEIEGE